MKCKCDIRTKLVGDGCEACNPQLVLDMALGAYWDAAVAEGAEGRDHDTPDGDAQRALEAVHSAVAAMVAAERDHERAVCQAVALLNGSVLSEGLGAWQPIATAPRDDAAVDLWRPNWQGDVALGKRCTNMRWVQLTKSNGFFDPVESGPCAVRDATHWMPMPDPPVSA